MARIEIRGEKELARKFEAMEASVAKEHLEAAVRAGGEIIRADASRRAPRRTGNLAENIDMEVAERKRSRVTVRIGPNRKAWYGRFVETGTSKMAPKPFLRPAVDENQARVEQAVRDVLRDRILGAAR